MDLWKNHSDDPDQLLCHGTAVTLADRGCLILGPSGSGKSQCALELISQGATLVADDRVWIRSMGRDLALHAPTAIAGQIEIRGVGVARLPHIPQTSFDFAVDLTHISKTRLPGLATQLVLGRQVPVLPGGSKTGLATLIKVLLLNGTGIFIH